VRASALSRRPQQSTPADRGVTPTGIDPVAAAAEARLHYVSDEDPGIRRVKAGKGFAYRRPDGRAVRDRATLSRIRALVIPPAWTDVWICPDGDGHIQATGRDARRRKQYRYHQRWRAVRDRTKFERLIEFACTLPRIRRAVSADLHRPGLQRDKVLAAVVRLLETTCIRVGSDEYARQNHHFGLTTLHDDHVDVSGAEMRFHFKGKSGKQHDVGLRDPSLARVVRNLQDLPGQRLFQYLDDTGQRHAIGSGDVNEYLRGVTGRDFTAKDFRTWAGTTLVMGALAASEDPSSLTAGKRQIVAAIDAAAERLGNTRSVCRSSYVHPAVLDAFSEGWLRTPPRVLRARSARGLDELELATLRVLEAAAARRRRAR
jgi:DNA topoisomerase-1